MKIVILTCNSVSSNIVFRNLIENKNNQIKAIIISNQISGGFKKKLKSYYRLFSKMSLKFFFYKIIEGPVFVLISKLNNIVMSTNNPKTMILRELSDKYGIPYKNIKNINSKESIKIIKSYKPDLILCYSSPILNQEVINCAKKACLNCHGGLLPKYKGAAQYIWYIINKEKIGGVTIHLITPKLDEGDMILKKTFKINNNDTAFSLHMKIAQAGAKLFPKIVEHYSNGEVKLKKQRKGFYCSIPTKNDMKLFPIGKLINFHELKSVIVQNNDNKKIK